MSPAPINQAQLNAAILDAIKQTEAALQPIIQRLEWYGAMKRREADDYYYRWRSED